ASSKRFIGYTGTRGDKSLGGLARPQVGVRGSYRKAEARLQKQKCVVMGYGD
ncbi:hypothetical protein LEMLEM_LOCUS17835, partial [Lemmus lemmus]